MEDIKNYMEDLVESYLDQILSQCKDVCKCAKCRKDIAAIALNNLPPHYSASQRGQVLTKANLLGKQVEADVISAITKGITIVGKEARHEA